MIFSFFKKIGFWGILGPPSYGMGATIRIGREIFVSRMRDFYFHFDGLLLFTIYSDRQVAFSILVHYLCW